MMAKTITTPLPSGRRAFGMVNKKVSTPVVNAQEKKLLKPQVLIQLIFFLLSCSLVFTSLYSCSQQETKVKPAPQIKVEEYPEMELFIPYDPLGKLVWDQNIGFE